MSKHRAQKPDPVAEATPRPVTADSSLTDILREEVRARQEIMRRTSWGRLQALRAELADLMFTPDDD